MRQTKLSAFEDRLDATIASLESVHAQTALLPQMQQLMHSIVAAHEGRAPADLPSQGADVQARRADDEMMSC